METLQQLLAEARKVLPEAVALRRRIHAEPECGLELPATREKVLGALDGLDLEIALHERTSGVVARLRGGRPGRTVLLRGDMDALPMPEDTELAFRSRTPGMMHACGHDAHTAMLAMAARVLASRREALHGDVLFAFQPGEEGYAGARFMIEEGLMDGEGGVDGAFALHVAPQVPPGMVAVRAGVVMASADEFEIEVTGRGGHASMPQDCIDPVPVACELVLALQAFVTRRIAVTDPVVLTVTTLEAGTTDNVIPERVRMTGTLRALSEAARARARDGMAHVVEHVARAHGTEASFTFHAGYPVTANDPGFAGFAAGVARELLGPRAVLEMPAPVMGAEDFSYVLQRVPGAMFFLGVRPPGAADPAPCHSNRMLLEEEAMAYGVALHTAVALRFLAPRADGARR